MKIKCNVILFCLFLICFSVNSYSQERKSQAKILKVGFFPYRILPPHTQLTYYSFHIEREMSYERFPHISHGSGIDYILILTPNDYGGYIKRIITHQVIYLKHKFSIYPFYKLFGKKQLRGIMIGISPFMYYLYNLDKWDAYGIGLMGHAGIQAIIAKRFMVGMETDFPLQFNFNNKGERVLLVGMISFRVGILLKKGKD